MENLKIREDLNDIVKNIGFKHIENKFGERNVCLVKLFNDKVIEFKDSDGTAEVLQSYADLGEKDYIESKKLVEELKTDEEGNNVGNYICVKYSLKDGSVYRLFASKFTSNKVIDNYYTLYKKLQKNEKK